MSNSESKDQQEQYSFLGFGDLFITLAQEHENNIIQAIRRYSILQDTNETEQPGNQGEVSSTPLVTPTETPTRTPHVTPIHTPRGSPRSCPKTEIFQSAELSRRTSELAIVSDLSLAIDCLPVKAAHSLPNIHLNTQKRTIMSYQAFDRSLRMYTKLEKEVQKIILDLEAAIQNDRGKYEVKKLLDIIDVDREALQEAGEEVNNYEPPHVNTSFNEEDWQTTWSKVDRRARAIIKTGKEYCLDKVEKVVPGTTPVVKFEKLQVEPFEGDPMVWSFWQENAKKSYFWFKSNRKKILVKAKNTRGGQRFHRSI